MKIFAIADTHLSGNPPQKPMSIFGDNWLNHWDKIKSDWISKVSAKDAVLLAGDISWAMKLDEAMADLEEISSLPGMKIMIRGNHDYWWQTLSKMNAAIGGRIVFLQNSFVALNNIAICGSRGWISPEDPGFKEADMVIYKRELGRVRASLAAAKAAGFGRIILMLHYPPLYDHCPSGFSELMTEFGVEICVYGHLHNESVKSAPVGDISGTTHFIVSCDALGFKLKQII